ncbi:MAG TPA: alpha/beta fold hydrolase [Mycobacteriales bacterium]|nr:alpha/beta fold hydrolase [Mycobacteriales bacterium]
MEQRLDEVRLSDGTRVAYAVVGSGPPLLFLPGWVSHLELGWALAAERRFCEALADGRALIRYDRPGTGLSGPASGADLVATELEIVEAVTGAVGADRFSLLGTSLSSALAVKWAVHRPETVDRLVLYGGWVDGRQLTTPAIRQHLVGLVREHWGLGSEILSDVFAPGSDPGFRAGFAAVQRESTTAERAAELLAASYAISVADDLADVTVPTFVIHREDERAVPVAEGRRLASGIAGAELTVLPGDQHIAFAGDVDALTDAIRSALGMARRRRRTHPVLTDRQLEVARLVAQGRSNRDIAQALVISERSAESHIDRIRTRLDLRSRAQLAAWYATSHPQVP